MYAKLVFPQGTKNTEVCRDIVRTIENSTGAGGSTVGALEFVDAGNSTIDDTVAANWSLAAGQSIATGSPVEQDKEFFLQQTHANGSTKTVVVRMFNKDDTGFSKAENVNGYQSVALRPVLDYGQSYEKTILCPQPNASANTTFSPTSGVTAWSSKSTVHIIARDKVIAIIGDRWGYTPGRSFEAILEAPTQYENNIGRNKPAQTFFHGAQSLGASFGSAGLSTKSYLYDFTSTNPMQTSYPQALGYFMCDTLHNIEYDKEVRVAGIHKTSFSPTKSSPANCDPNSQLAQCAPTRDITQADGFGAVWNQSTTGEFSTEAYFFPSSSSSWGYSPHAYSFDPTNAFLNVNIDATDPRDPAGNPAVQLTPITFRIGNAGGYYDFTSECGLYVGTTNAPFGVNVLNDGTDDYVALRTNDTAGRDGLIVLKV